MSLISFPLGAVHPVELQLLDVVSVAEKAVGMIRSRSVDDLNALLNGHGIPNEHRSEAVRQIAVGHSLSLAFFELRNREPALDSGEVESVASALQENDFLSRILPARQLQILRFLWDVEERHGYAIAHETKIPVGTIYVTLRRMVEKGELEDRVEPRPGVGPVVRYYRISPLGLRLLGRRREADVLEFADGMRIRLKKDGLLPQGTFTHTIFTSLKRGWGKNDPVWKAMKSWCDAHLRAESDPYHGSAADLSLWIQVERMKSVFGGG